jgi:undecaprenyl-diphosphatase
MSVLSAIFYGIIQGLTEFLPVSSSGHLAIAHGLFGGSEGTDRFTFDILLHLATLAAVLIVYWRDIFPLIPAFFRVAGKLFRGKFRLTECDEHEKMLVYLVIATLPLIAAVFLNDKVELIGNYPKIVGGILILNGVVLFLSDRIGKGDRDLGSMKPKSALAVGLCQLCAIVPGLSRSGSTITGGRLCGFTREFAVKFSFILSIPAILGANIFEIPEMVSNPVPASDIPAYALGMLAAALTGIAAMKLLSYVSKKSNFHVFSLYCVIVGIIAIVFA